MLGLSADKPNSSPLAGLPSFRDQQAESGLRLLRRREWWLWLSAVLVTTLSALAFLLSSFTSFFLHHDHFYEIRSDQARWGVLCLLLLFNSWLLYRQWSFRRARRQLTDQNVGTEATPSLISGSGERDPATGLYTRIFIEQQLGKEIARAKRQNSALSLATIHLEEFDQLSNGYGVTAANEALKEFARRLKKACRGSDFAARLAKDDFLLVLPECGVGEVKVVLNRLGSLEMNCAGRRMNLTCTTGWVDYQAGDLPADMLKRAAQLLHLYDDAAKGSFSSTLATH